MVPEDRRIEFEATCLPFTGSLYGTALRLIHRPEDAEDLVQETFLRAYRTFRNFRSGSNARAWLFTILHSIFVNRCRRGRREPESVPLEEVDESFLAGALQGDAAGVEAAENALREVPELFQAALLLVNLEGLSYEQAAAALGCPVGTLRSRLSRGRRRLLARLGGRKGTRRGSMGGRG